MSNPVTKLKEYRNKNSDDYNVSPLNKNYKSLENSWIHFADFFEKETTKTIHTSGAYFIYFSK
ncbi:MAG: hypothetical protein WB492_03095 [Christiangramia sp.]